MNVKFRNFCNLALIDWFLNIKGYLAISASVLEEFNGAINQPISIKLLVIKQLFGSFKSLLRDSE